MSTPATVALDAAGIRYTTSTYELPDDADGYGLGAADALGLDPDEIAKTLVARLDDGSFVCAVVPSSGSLDLKALARAAGVKKAAMATVPDAERITGYVRGGISPLGQRRQLPVYVDELLLVLDVVHISGGKRGFEISLAPDDLVAAAAATVAPLS